MALYPPKYKYIGIQILLFLIGVFAFMGHALAEAPTTSIGFQGQLMNAGSPVNASVTATFTFYDTSTGGVAQGSVISKTVSVSNGYFSTTFSAADTTGIDFNQALWLEVSVEGNTLSPRSQINSVPFAHKAFGAFAYISAPSIGPTGSLYFDTTSNLLKVSNGTSWIDVSTSTLSGWTSNGSHIHNNNAGNVGIGTTTPTSKLSIAGDINLTGALKISGSAGANGQVLQTTGTGVQWVSTSTLGFLTMSDLSPYLSLSAWTSTTTDALTEGTSNLYFTDARARNAVSSTATGLTYSASTGQFTLTSGYSVPLTASTTEWAAGYASSTIFSSFYITPSSRITAGAGLEWTGNTLANSGVLSIGGLTGDVATSSLGIVSSQWVTDSSNISYTTGNVGIGTTNANDRLTIKSGSSNSNPLNILNSSNSSIFRIGDTVTGAGLASLFDSTGTEAVRLFAEGSSYFNGGNVGIGTTTPNNVLSILSNNGRIQFGNTGSGYGAIGFSSGVVSSSNYSLTGEGSNTFLNAPTSGYISFRNGNTDQMRLTSSGNFGIGTVSPQYKLEVNGSASTTVLHLPHTSGSVGGIYFGGSKFIHNNGHTSNTFAGMNAGQNASGAYNTAFGNSALLSVTTGSLNTAVGQSALNSNISGSQNTAIGREALVSSTGNNNTGVGYGAGRNITSGSNNIAIGYSSYVPSPTGSYQLNIGNLIYGTGLNGTGDILSTGNIGIGTTTPSAKLDISDISLAGSGSLAGSALNIAQTWNTTGTPTALKLNVTDTASNASSLLADLQVGGVSKFQVAKNGGITTSGGTSVFGGSLMNSSGNIISAGGFVLSYANQDVWLQRDSAGVLAQRNGVNAQTFRLYNTYTDASNYERAGLNWSGNVLTLGTENGGTGSARNLAFTTGSTTRMTIDTSGNVGIGTTTPTTKLVVEDATVSPVIRVSSAGNASLNPSIDLFRNSSVNGSISYSGGGGDLVLTNNWSDVTADIIFNTNNAGERMRITGLGNLGIGTTTPTQKLTIGGAASGILLDSGGSRFVSLVTGNTNGALTVTAGSDNNATTSAFMINAKGYNNTSLSTRNLFGIQNNGADILTVTSDGNFGIGTTTPSAKLVVSGSTGIITTSGTGSGYSKWYNSDTSSRIGHNDASGVFVEFNQNGLVTLNSRVAVGSASVGGDVGDFSAGVSGSSQLMWRRYGAAGRPALEFYNSSNQLVTYISANTASSTYFNSGSNVGIGTTTPSAKLEILGTTKITSGSNYMSLDAATQPYLQLFHAGTIDARLYTRAGSTVGSQNISAGLGIYNAATSTTAGLLVSKLGANGGIIAIGNTGGDSQLHIAAPSGYSSFVSFREDGIADKGVIGFSNGSNDMQFRVNNSTSMTNGTEVMRLTSAGNVGIGTSTPSYKLDVDGDMRIGQIGSNTTLHFPNSVSGFASKLSTTYGSNAFTITGGSNTILMDQNRIVTGGSAYTEVNNGNHYLRLGVNSVESMRIINGGNVGIGTTTPGSKLDVAGNIDLASGQSTGVLRFRNGASKYFTITSSDTAVDFQSFSTTPLRFQNAGGGGIDFGTPVTFSGGIADLGNSVPFGGGSGGGAGALTYIKQSYGADFQSYGSKPIVFNAGGNNVGIGTTSPKAKLQVGASTGNMGVVGSSVLYLAGGGIRVGSNSGDDYGYQMYRSSSTGDLTLIGDQGSNSQFAFQNSAGSTLFRILNSGNVGIGTTTPTSKLSIVDATGLPIIHLSTTGGHFPSMRFERPAQVTWDIGTFTTHANSFAIRNITSSLSPIVIADTASTGSLHIGNNVTGIGTSSPSARLHVSGAANDNFGQLIVQSNNNNYSGISILTGAPNTSANRNWQIATNYNSSGSFEILRSASSTANSGATTNTLFINSSGNVGIATTSVASYRFTVDGTSLFSATSSIAGLTITGSGATPTLNNETDGNNKTLAFRNLGASGGWGGGYTFYAGTSGTASNQVGLRIQTNGSTEGSTKIGLGDISAAAMQGATARLVVRSPAANGSETSNDTGINIYTNNSGSYTLASNKVFRGIYMGGYGSNSVVPNFATSSNQYGISIGYQYQPLSNGYGSSMVFTGANDSGQQVEIMRLLGKDGNVGIGTTTPTQKLVVVGSAQFTNIGIAAGANDLHVTADGTLTTSASDIRLKENILALASTTLDKLLALKTYTFTWKSDTAGKVDIGMIAQEVEEIFPEITFTNKTDGYKGINYSRLNTLLVRGMQEQQVQIDELKKYATFIRTKELHTEKLCIGEDDDEVCINKEQLRSLLQSVVTPQSAPSTSSTPTGGSDSSANDTGTNTDTGTNGSVDSGSQSGSDSGTGSDTTTGDEATDTGGASAGSEGTDTNTEAPPETVSEVSVVEPPSEPPVIAPTE